MERGGYGGGVVREPPVGVPTPLGPLCDGTACVMTGDALVNTKNRRLCAVRSLTLSSYVERNGEYGEPAAQRGAVV